MKKNMNWSLLTLFYSVFVVGFLLVSGALYASGNTAGGGGKSAGQAQDTDVNFKGEIEKTRKKSLNESKGVEARIDHSHQLLSEILAKNVHVIRKGQASQFDYKSVDKEKLKSYLQPLLSLKKSHVDSWSRQQQLAYYFNVYNALTIDLILRHYPIESIKELGSGFPFFQSPWKKKFFKLFGQWSYLDKIEHELVRDNSKIRDPLVHFAFNCAAIGCPALLPEAFNTYKLEQQLQLATSNFLKDRERNYIKEDIAYVSSIFKWYREDFERGQRNFNSLKDFFFFYRNSLADNREQLSLLEGKKYKIKFLEYDWRLNDKK